jgi:hypothetical protein
MNEVQNIDDNVDADTAINFAISASLSKYAPLSDNANSSIV